jgi:exodeoxyribonuclease V gamma subunit
LHVRLRKTDGALDEREPFDLDARDGYSLKQRLLADRLDGIESEQALSQFAATGVLPLGQVGQARSRSISAAVDSFWQRLERFDPLRARTVLEVDLDLGGFRLTGRVIARESGGVLNARVASVKSQDILVLWIQHLAAGAVGHGGESILIGTNATHSYQPCDHAVETLRDLLELYWQGLRQPMRFFPRASRAFAQAEHKRARHPRSKVNPLAEALKQWEGNEFRSVPAEREDLSFKLCFGDVTPLDDEFAALARRVFGPVLRHEAVEEA